MSQPLSLLFDTKIHAGKLPEAKKIASTLVADVKANEPQTLQYQCLVDESSSRLCFHDTYASSEAFLEHVNRPSVSEALNKILAISDLNGFTILGDVSAPAKKVLTTMGATFVTPLAGFDRLEQATAGMHV